jgi:hypothetical protein
VLLGGWNNIFWQGDALPLAQRTFNRLNDISWNRSPLAAVMSSPGIPHR